MTNKEDKQEIKEKKSFDLFKKEILNDYRICILSREASLLGRKEVLTGKAKFGIFGDGKEVAQIALSKYFQKGDFRAGYYRDQTIALATGVISLEEWFAQLYANPDLEKEPCSAGRQMNSHFATRSLDENGEWNDLTEIKNFSSDISPTASQMPRALGLAMASKFYRNNSDIKSANKFSKNGNEVVFATIGDASTSEGIFWETLNAAGVLQVPLVISVWDDGYGISVPKKYQTTKENISDIIAGFEYEKDRGGLRIYKVKAWDYAALIKTYEQAINETRKTHIPCLVHVEEATQPQGHSTSGSHERYKTKDRLAWEEKFDGIKKMSEWILSHSFATPDEIDQINKEAKEAVLEAKRNAWKDFLVPIKKGVKDLALLLDDIIKTEPKNKELIEGYRSELISKLDPYRRDIIQTARKSLLLLNGEHGNSIIKLREFKNKLDEENLDYFNSHLYSQSEKSVMNISEIAPEFSDKSTEIPGYQILNKCFDFHFKNNEFFVAFGEDVGQIGDVNQGFAGLQEKHGINRLFDTGIREATIMGQGIGMAMRGVRPIAEIQYLDYLIYGLQQLSDDLATLQYRTKGGQKAPLIIRTRGHRLEGIWHTGSPLGMVLNSLRGIFVLTPRNMTKAAGMYNTMLRSDDCALIIECLNGYRLREMLPDNIDKITVPLGVPEIINEGNDISIVTYGSNCRIAMETAKEMKKLNISCEVIDVQTLIPFDINHMILDSIKKTNKVIFFDEDVPGGASAYMYQKVIEDQEAYYYLDSKPVTLTAKEHRSAYGSDGDYFTKPSSDDLSELIYSIMNESNPLSYPL